MKISSFFLKPFTKRGAQALILTVMDRISSETSEEKHGKTALSSLFVSYSLHTPVIIKGSISLFCTMILAFALY